MASSGSEGGASGGGLDGGARRRRRYSPPLLHALLLLCGVAGEVGRRWLTREGRTTDSQWDFLIVFVNVNELKGVD